MDQDKAMCLQTSVTVCSFVIASIAVHMMKHKLRHASLVFCLLLLDQ